LTGERKLSFARSSGLTIGEALDFPRVKRGGYGSYAGFADDESA
jgi:hypothetical protein